jgi:hypothetical protein
MLRTTHRVFLLFVCIAALCGSSYSQTGKTITVRMLDGRTGKLISPSNFLVRVDHEQTAHANWVVQNEDRTGTLTVPLGAAVLTIQATYDSATSYYLDCDAINGHGASDHEPSLDRWYKIADILASGVVARNDCAGKKLPEKLQTFAKPGEFVFFVRRQNWLEEMQEYSAH